jgi:fido (protein-threonine AMPylation protein)
MEQAKLKENIKAILDTYHKEIESATDEYAKLAAIARCCQDLEQIHAFSDGNGRTIAFGVLTKLLLENRLTPCIMHDTSHIDGFSVKELVEEFRKGQETFRKWCNQTSEQ